MAETDEKAPQSKEQSVCYNKDSMCYNRDEASRPAWQQRQCVQKTRVYTKLRVERMNARREGQRKKRAADEAAEKKE